MPCFLSGGPCSHGESADDAAVRETFEKLGLHLDGVDFRRVGPLDEHRVRNFIMCPVVYWQVCPQTPAMHASADVAAMRWVDINLCLLDPLHWRPKGHSITPAHFIPLSDTWRHRLGLNTARFPCVDLQAAPRAVGTVPAAGEDDETPFTLWGLALLITSDLVYQGTGRAPLDQSPIRFDGWWQDSLACLLAGGGADLQALWDGRRSLSTLSLRAMLLACLILLLLVSFVGWGLMPQLWPRLWEFGRFVIVGWRNLLGI